jgi:hypothetical protein
VLNESQGLCVAFFFNPKPKTQHSKPFFLTPVRSCSLEAHTCVLNESQGLCVAFFFNPKPKTQHSKPFFLTPVRVAH